jgi:hypothetical protein
MIPPKMKTSARGYGATHQRKRRVWARRIASGEQISCARCGYPILRGCSGISVMSTAAARLSTPVQNTKLATGLSRRTRPSVGEGHGGLTDCLAR